ncbi:MAG: FRG domain-containing protein [Chloroflexota bacterium]|nr:FRG domain-containing protein [Chloroflexota bacterium]
MSNVSFDELIERPANDSYIFRGESMAFRLVSSGLFREYSRPCDMEDCCAANEEVTICRRTPWDIEAYQRVELEDVKRFTTVTDDRTILTEIQHYGGKTNLIDFTTDYYVALFFACEARYEEDGRVIFMDKSKEMHEHICEPIKENSRVNVQKSIFVRPPRGYIEDRQYETITIPKNLKGRLLDYLKWKHKISQRSVYNDIHGFIEYRRVHSEAFDHFRKGFACQRKGKLGEAITHYTRAINCNPDLFDAYNNRGLAHKSLGEYECAIKDYDIAARLPHNTAKDYARLFHNRGCAYSAMGGMLRQSRISTNRWR